jgi:hypothetical protein
VTHRPATLRPINLWCGFILAAALAGPASADDGLSTLTRWLAPGADVEARLTRSPGECLAPGDDDQARYLIAIGRAAFRTPFLLGGQAARGGLSCNACHIDGGDNPDFFLRGLSGAPGTADVTSSVFSAVRDDGVFNPLPIPSLVGAGEKKAFGSHAPASSIRAFVASAVAEEFQGAPPSDAILDGVAAYVAALSPDDCPRAAVIAGPQSAAAEAAARLDLAAEALAAGDSDTADFLLLSAQAALGEIHVRFSGAGFAAERALIEAQSRKLGALRRNPRSADASAQAGVTRRLGERLQTHHKGSLYDAAAIRAALDREGVAGD